MTKLKINCPKSKSSCLEVEGSANVDPIAAKHFSDLFREFPPQLLFEILNSSHMFFPTKVGNDIRDEMHLEICNMKGILFEICFVKPSSKETLQADTVEQLLGEYSLLKKYKIYQGFLRGIIQAINACTFEFAYYSGLMALMETYLKIYIEKQGKEFD